MVRQAIHAAVAPRGEAQFTVAPNGGKMLDAVVLGGGGAVPLGIPLRAAFSEQLVVPFAGNLPAVPDAQLRQQLVAAAAAALRETLLACDEFDSNRDLRDLFWNARLAAWHDRLPEGDSRMQRADRLIAYLQNRCNARGEAALALLLAVLRERYQPDDERHRALGNLLV